ncbi:MAG: methylmalonyl Co-A mutase-associated GTPase MeaB [Deltaproteobacteria bacterium]|nr:methylmalonyl Co-A mutase-associated GTPase MeaB [Deltaproteobacteria bacterium]
MTSLATQILAGDVLAASRLMRDVDDRLPEAIKILKELFPYTGRADIIGITGAPGSGKSTLVDRMVEVFRKDGKSVGVVAIDPSSPFSGGALLGDRFRMQRHTNDAGVFIRSLATRGCLGGLTRSTHDIVNVMDAMGKDIILVETVGVGQDEVEIANLAHTAIVVLAPGMGDDIQAMKAGIIEIADIFVINKCEREGADKTERELRMVLSMSSRRDKEWEPDIFQTEAILGKGIVELLAGISRHKQALEQSGGLDRKLRARKKAIFLEILQNELMNHFVAAIEEKGRWDQIIDDLIEKRIDPYSLVKRLMMEEFDNKERWKDIL